MQHRPQPRPRPAPPAMAAPHTAALPPGPPWGRRGSAPPLTAAAPGPSSGGGEASFRRGPRCNGGAGGEAAAVPRRAERLSAVTQPPRGSGQLWSSTKGPRGDGAGGQALPPAGYWRSGSRWSRRREDGTAPPLRAPPLAEPRGAAALGCGCGAALGRGRCAQRSVDCLSPIGGFVFRLSPFISCSPAKLAGEG